MNQQIQKQTPSPQRALLDKLREGARTGEGLAARLRIAAENFNLISPTLSGSLPEGCEAIFSPVLIDIKNETYKLPGSSKMGLSKQALQRIAAAAGLSWMPSESRRLDDGSDPHYCHYRAVALRRNFDGSTATLMAEKVMDLREGSAQVESMVSKSDSKAARGGAADSRTAGLEKVRKQLVETRLHIMGHAETKAQLRVIRSLGIATGYDEETLRKPFVVVSVSFTGRTDDPELKKIFGQAIANNMLGAHAALYGGHRPEAPRELAAPPTMSRPLPPPPVSQTRVEDSGEYDLEPMDTTAYEAPSQRQEAPPQTQREQPPREGSGDAVIRFGNAKDVPIRQAEDRDLRWYATALERSINDPDKDRYKQQNQRDLDAVRAEIARREGADAEY